MATTFLVVKNRAVSTLAAGIDDAVVELTVAAGEGALFPTTFPFHITIDDEILSCTGRVVDVLTVVRDQQGTAAAAHAEAADVKLNITAKSITDLNTAVNALEAASYTPPARSFSKFPDHTVGKNPEGLGDFAVLNHHTVDVESYWSFNVPADFGSLTSVKICFIGGQSNGETADWTVTTDFHANGEAYNNHSDSATADGLTPVNNQGHEIDITAAFTGLLLGDRCGVKFKLDAISDYPDVRVITLEFVYAE